MEFNYKQLIFAREYRGYNQTELSKKIRGLSQPNLSKFEKGLGTLSEDNIQNIIKFLDFPQKFFHKKIYNTIENAHFRKKSGILKNERLYIENSIKIVGYIIDNMEDSIEFPDFSFKTFDIEEGYSPESIANYTRKLLGLKEDEPVKYINELLESHGIIIVEIDAIEKFDGVSILTDKGRHVIIINKNFPNDRKRFTISHELGHLLMHMIPVSEMRDKEKEANNFASEFLMPKNVIKHTLRGLKLSYLKELKKYWLTSMQSIILRAKDLNCISKRKYSYLYIEFSRNGWRTKEPFNVFIDEPQVFIKAYEMHKNELEYSDSELAEAFNIPLDVLQRFCKKNQGKAKLRILTN